MGMTWHKLSEPISIDGGDERNYHAQFSSLRSRCAVCGTHSKWTHERTNNEQTHTARRYRRQQQQQLYDAVYADTTKAQTCAHQSMSHITVSFASILFLYFFSRLSFIRTKCLFSVLSNNSSTLIIFRTNLVLSVLCSRIASTVHSEPLNKYCVAWRRVGQRKWLFYFS